MTCRYCGCGGVVKITRSTKQSVENHPAYCHITGKQYTTRYYTGVVKTEVFMGCSSCGLPVNGHEIIKYDVCSPGILERTLCEAGVEFDKIIASKKADTGSVGVTAEIISARATKIANKEIQSRRALHYQMTQNKNCL
jgi:hypothetical protein